MTSPFGPDDVTAPGEDVLDDVGEGEPDDSSDDSGAGGDDPAAR